MRAAVAFTEADDPGLLEMVAMMMRTTLNVGMPSESPNPSAKMLGDRRQGKEAAINWLHSDEFTGYCGLFDCDSDLIRRVLLARLETGTKIVPGVESDLPWAQWNQNMNWAQWTKVDDD